MWGTQVVQFSCGISDLIVCSKNTIGHVCLVTPPKTMVTNNWFVNLGGTMWTSNTLWNCILAGEKKWLVTCVTDVTHGSLHPPQDNRATVRETANEPGIGQAKLEGTKRRKHSNKQLKQKSQLCLGRKKSIQQHTFCCGTVLFPFSALGSQTKSETPAKMHTSKLLMLLTMVTKTWNQLQTTSITWDYYLPWERRLKLRPFREI